MLNLRVSTRCILQVAPTDHQLRIESTWISSTTVRKQSKRQSDTTTM